MLARTYSPREYHGVFINYQSEPGKLPWTARIEGHGQLAADTLIGIKELIRDTLKGTH